MLTNKQTNWQTNTSHWRHAPRSAMLCQWVKYVLLPLPSLNAKFIAYRQTSTTTYKVT